MPTLWKTSIICPVPKKAKVSTLNDFRPIALTPVVMKCFERIVLTKLLSQTSHLLDPLQFAYKHNRGTDDATITLLHFIQSHLEKPASFARILYVDFSSAFNTVQPHLMAHKLIKFGVDSRLVLWVIDFLVNRVQFVRCHNSLTGQPVMSSPCITHTGTPQGTVVSPVLFTMYTDDCRCESAASHLVKYSDDTALVDLSNSHSHFTAEVNRFNLWCSDNFLNLNVQKTKEMIIDFRRSQTAEPELKIGDVSVERVNQYKYLGTVIDKKNSTSTQILITLSLSVKEGFSVSVNSAVSM